MRCTPPLTRTPIGARARTGAGAVVLHDVPDDIDRRVAEIKLDAEGVAYDSLSDEQREYMDGWRHGT